MNYLTQEEIDALLQGAPTSDAIGQAEIQPYNFRRPPRIPRDRQMVLDAVHNGWALAVQSYLSSRLRQTTDVSVASVELVSFAEVRMSLGEPCATWFFALGDNGGHQGILDLDARLVTHLVDRLFGGPGDDGRVVRLPTVLELQVLKGVTDRILALWRDAWADHLTTAPAVGSFETIPENIVLAAPEENVLVANLSISSGLGRGTLAICLPFGAVEAFLQARTGMVSKPALSRGPDAVARRQGIEHQLRTVQIPVAARLPEFRLSAHDVAAFQVGQILETGNAPNGPVELRVNGRHLFVGTLGRFEGAVGLRVAERANPNAVPRPQRRKVIP